jgi:hypothetical protein
MAVCDGLKAGSGKVKCQGTGGKIACIIALSFDCDKPSLRLCQESGLQIPEPAVGALALEKFYLQPAFQYATVL